MSLLPDQEKKTVEFTRHHHRAVALDRSGTVLELVFINGTQDDFPDRIDPDIAAASHINYWIYFRG